MRLVAAAIVVATAWLAPAAAQAPPRSPAPLEIHFLDVGQGDATLIRVGGRAVLVDGGPGRDLILVLADYPVDSFAALVASHNHDDHIRGLAAVLADYPVARFYDNGRPPTTAIAREVADRVARAGISRPALPAPPILLDDVRITVLAPPPLGGASENNASLGVLVERGRFKALLTGDSEREELGAWLAAGVIPDVDVLKAAHHGARNGVSPGWIERTRPEVVVISAGAGNPYGHPDPLALRYYGRRARTIYRTDLHGTVTVTVEPDGRYQVGTAGPTPR